MDKSKIGSRERIHFIGIGGIGMSGLAQVMKDMGFNVQGSDVTNSKNVERCKKIGIRVFTKQKNENIKNATIIVRSSAIHNNNPEIKAAKNKKLTILKLLKAWEASRMIELIERIPEKNNITRASIFGG